MDEASEAKFVRVGGPVPPDYKGVYELVMDDFVQALEPPRSFELDNFDPVYYFITSGDAIEKAKHMRAIINRYAGSARRQLNSMDNQTKAAEAFEKDCWKQMGAVTKLINALEKVRGDAIFLETEWNDGHLLCIPKNPRMKKPQCES